MNIRLPSLLTPKSIGSKWPAPPKQFEVETADFIDIPPVSIDQMREYYRTASIERQDALNEVDRLDCEMKLLTEKIYAALREDGINEG